MLCFLHRWEESIPMFDKLLQLTDEPYALYLRGSAKKNIENKLEEAIEDFQAFLEKAHPHERKIPIGNLLSYISYLDISLLFSCNISNKR